MVVYEGFVLPDRIPGRLVLAHTEKEARTPSLFLY